MKRICIICRKNRRTTNGQYPYICEICLRSKGRNLLLNLDEFLEKAKQESKENMYPVVILVCIISIAITWFVLKII